MHVMSTYQSIGTQPLTLKQDRGEKLASMLRLAEHTRPVNSHSNPSQCKRQGAPYFSVGGGLSKANRYFKGKARQKPRLLQPSS